MTVIILLKIKVQTSLGILQYRSFSGSVHKTKLYRHNCTCHVKTNVLMSKTDDNSHLAGQLSKNIHLSPQSIIIFTINVETSGYFSRYLQRDFTLQTLVHDVNLHFVICYQVCKYEMRISNNRWSTRAVCAIKI